MAIVAETKITKPAKTDAMMILMSKSVEASKRVLMEGLEFVTVAVELSFCDEGVG